MNGFMAGIYALGLARAASEAAHDCADVKILQIAGGTNLVHRVFNVPFLG